MFRDIATIAEISLEGRWLDQMRPAQARYGTIKVAVRLVERTHLLEQLYVFGITLNGVLQYLLSRVEEDIGDLAAEDGVKRRMKCIIAKKRTDLLADEECGEAVALFV